MGKPGEGLAHELLHTTYGQGLNGKAAHRNTISLNIDALYKAKNSINKSPKSLHTKDNTNQKNPIEDISSRKKAE